MPELPSGRTDEWPKRLNYNDIVSSKTTSSIREKAGIDYLATDTSIGFDKALMEYLLQRQRRF